MTDAVTTLPDEPDFCVVPVWDVETGMQQIRIVFADVRARARANRPRGPDSR